MWSSQEYDGPNWEAGTIPVVVSLVRAILDTVSWTYMPMVPASVIACQV